MVQFLDLQQVNRLHAQEILEAMERVVDSGWFIRGNECQRFEEQYANYIGTRYCVGVGNGLDALTLIYRAYIEMGLMKPGDEVIVPANTYIASILAITENRLRPVLVEPRWDSLEIDDSLIEKAITPRTRSIMIVHLYGRCAYTEKIGELCRKYSLLLVEDNAQAHGCRYAGSDSESTGSLGDELPLTGSLGDAAGHSFYPGKNLGALGDAGAVTTNNGELAELVRTLANYGSQKKYVFQFQGRNSRLDELQAAVLCVKLRYLENENAHRQHIADYYYQNIAHPAVTLPRYLSHRSNVYHLFPIFTEQRDKLQQHLSSKGIQTLIHYPLPPHQQECYEKEEWAACKLPITEKIHRQELSLPISQVMSLADAKRVVECVNSWNV